MDRTRIYVGGQWVPSSGPDTITVVNPATEQELAQVPAGADADVDAAVAAARAAFDSWSAVPPAERGKQLLRATQALEARRDELAETVTADVGSPIAFARAVQVDYPLQVLGAYGELAEDYPWEERLGTARIVRAPSGVVAAITPWNFPVFEIVTKVAPALLAGCTVVLKPSEIAPLSAWIFAEVFDEIGLPDGVFNVVSGEGATIGEALVRHPDVDTITFTGSTRAGKRIAAVAADTVKRVTLELGGKSASIVLDDAEFTGALTGTLGYCYMNSGQVCVALSRLLVPRSRHDEAVEWLRTTVEAMTVGDPSTDVQIGPMVSAAQRARVLGHIHRGIEEGAQLVTGGTAPPDGLDTGFYVRPTVFANVDNAMTVASEEIFGPVLSVIPYDDEDEAVRIANDTVYGLSGAVWSADSERAERIARRLRTGTVLVNGGGGTLGAPFGGFKQSGLGRESGRFGVDEFVELQSIDVAAG